MIMTQSFSGALGFNREMNNSLWVRKFNLKKLEFLRTNQREI